MFRRFLPWLVATLIVIAAVALGVSLLSGGEGDHHAPTVTAQPTQGPPITAPKSTVDRTKVAARRGEIGDLAKHAQARTETIGGKTRSKLSQEAKRGTTGSDSPTPIVKGASFTQPGCRTIAVGNYSGRGSQRPGLGVAHYWAAANHPGWGDVLGVVGLFNNRRYQASSNYVTDREGHCAYIVPESAKAWTQGNMNGATACSIEMGGDFNDYGYQGAGLRIAARVFVACFKRWGIPIRVGKTSGCTIVRTGLVDHDELGCGNDHTDIRTAGRCPTSGNACVQSIVAEMRRIAGTSSVNATVALAKPERLAASRRCYHRHKYRTGHSATQARYTRRWIAVLKRQRIALRKLGLTDRRHRKARHRLLGAYVTGKACR